MHASSRADIQRTTNDDILREFAGWTLGTKARQVVDTCLGAAMNAWALLA